ncbi:MAG: hypothetical protein R2912_10905 [Eubacteriales bacterium]
MACKGTHRRGAYKHALATGGAAIVIGGALNRVFQIMAFGWLYSMGGKRIRVLAAKPNAADTEALMQLVAAGSIRPVIEKIVHWRSWMRRSTMWRRSTRAAKSSSA